MQQDVGWASAAPRSSAHAVIDAGSDTVPDDLAAKYHRVGGKAAHPTFLRFNPRNYAVSPNNSRPINMRRISLVPAPIS